LSWKITQDGLERKHSSLIDPSCPVLGLNYDAMFDTGQIKFPVHIDLMFCLKPLFNYIMLDSDVSRINNS